jgi:uncharacterized damage-inducible protein DinB
VNKADILMLFDYNYWANNRVLAQAAALPPSECEAPVPGLNGNTLKKTLVHVLAAEQIWRLRCLDGISPAGALAPDMFPSFDALKQRWDQEEQLMRQGLARLPQEKLGETFAYQTTKGTTARNVRWQALVHMVNHGTQHRAEAGVVLSSLGRSPGDLDLILFLRDRDGNRPAHS